MPHDNMPCRGGGNSDAPWHCAKLGELWMPPSGTMPDAKGFSHLALCQLEQGPWHLGPSSWKFWDGGLDVFCSCASSAQ